MKIIATTTIVLGFLSTTAHATSLVDYANARADSLIGTTKPHQVIAEMMEVPIGTAGNKWTPKYVNSGYLSYSTTVPGGVAKLFTGTTTSSGTSIYLGTLAKDNAVLPDPNSGSFYELFVFRFNSTPGSGTGFNLGSIGTGTSAYYLRCGIYDVASTTNFSCGNNLNNIVSTVSIDTSWHAAEIWTTGNGVVHFAIDGETPQTITIGTYGVSQPAINIGNGSTTTSQELDVDAAIYVFDVNGGVFP
jgi:hypothetical protein